MKSHAKLSRANIRWSHNNKVLHGTLKRPISTVVSIWACAGHEERSICENAVNHTHGQLFRTEGKGSTPLYREDGLEEDHCTTL